MSADGRVEAGTDRVRAPAPGAAPRGESVESVESATASRDGRPDVPAPRAVRDDVPALKKELRANRKKVASLQRSQSELIFDLGRHVSNLGLDAGYDELTHIIKKTVTIRENLAEVEEELKWVADVADEHVVMHRDLERTKDEAKELTAKLDTSIVELGAHAHRMHQSPQISVDFRTFLAEMIEQDEEWRPSIVDDIPDARMGIRARLRSLKEKFEPRVDPTRGLYPRIGWRLLRSASDDRCVDPVLKDAVAAAKKGVARLLELERHQRYREDNLDEFESEMRDSWGYDNISAMVEDLERQRDDMRESADAYYLEIGTIFNTHRLHDYVQDSFVKSCRRRIKRLHVRMNELRLRQRDIVRTLKRAKASRAPEQGELEGA